MAINKLSFLILRLLNHIISFTVLQDLDFSIHLEMQSYFLISRSLLQVVRHNVEVVLDHIAQRSGISQFQKDVVNWADEDILDSMGMHVLQNTLVLHFGVDSTVSARSQREIALTFNYDLSFVTESRDSALREEDNRVLIISKVIIFLEIVDNFIVVHLAGHQVPFNEAFRIVHTSPSLGQVTQAFQPVGEVAKQSKSTLQAQIKHTLGMVESESGPLSSTHDANSHLSLGNGHIPKLVKVSCLSLNILMGGNIADGRKLVLLVLFESRLVDIDMLEQLCSLLVVDAFQLLQEALLFDWVLNGVEVFNEMVLFVLSDSLEDGWSFHKIFYIKSKISNTQIYDPVIKLTTICFCLWVTIEEQPNKELRDV